MLTVTATRADGKTDPIKIENLYLYENGVEQRIRNFSIDPSPSRIVLLVDNSQTLPTDIERLKGAAMEFAYEIFDGDQLFVIAYDEKPEIIQEWTDNADKMKESFSTFRKKGNPHLFDAINSALKEVLIPLMPGTRKTSIVIIGDGLDAEASRHSIRSLPIFSSIMSRSILFSSPTAQEGHIVETYRNRHRDLATTEATRRHFSFEEAQTAAKTICDELRSNRYLLSYQPQNTSTYNANVFSDGRRGISVRTKLFQPQTSNRPSNNVSTQR